MPLSSEYEISFFLKKVISLRQSGSTRRWSQDKRRERAKERETRTLVWPIAKDQFSSSSSAWSGLDCPSCLRVICSDFDKRLVVQCFRCFFRIGKTTVTTSMRSREKERRRRRGKHKVTFEHLNLSGSSFSIVFIPLSYCCFSLIVLIIHCGRLFVLLWTLLQISSVVFTLGRLYVNEMASKRVGE